MQTNIEKLAEELSALESLRSAGITIRVSVPDRRVHLNLPFGHTLAYFEFDEILPFDPNGAPGTVSDLCKNNQIHVLTDMDFLSRKQAKAVGPRVYAYLSYLIHQAAQEGKITSPEMAALKFPADELRRRKADLKTIATKFAGSHAEFLKSIDPVQGALSHLKPAALDGVVDATDAKTAGEFIDKYLTKEKPPSEYKTPEEDYPEILQRQREWMRQEMPKLLAGLEPLIKEYKLSDHDAYDILFDAKCEHDIGVNHQTTINGMAYDLKHGIRPEKQKAEPEGLASVGEHHKSISKGVPTVADNVPDRFPAGPFASLGKALFGEQGWETKIALELKVDKSTISEWAHEGVPGTMLEALWHISSHHRAKIQEAMKMPGMPDADLKPWHRGGRLLEEYELISQDPTMLPSSTDVEQNRKIIVRIIADLLHFCMHSITTTRTFIDIDGVIRDAITMYRTDPEHSATPSVEAEKVRPALLIPYVLTADPAKIADFQNEFGLSQAAAVDVLIEETDWGAEDLPHLRGKKGKPAERLRELRRVLREAGQTE
jgi:hypothetical protein